MGNPQVQELQTAVALKAAGLGIPKVANIGPVENATDNARYRPGARKSPPLALAATGRPRRGG